MPDPLYEVEQEADGRWIAEIPSMPGVLCYGDTPEAAISSAAALAAQVLAGGGDAAGQLETLAQERDTARELCRDAIQERDEWRLAVVAASRISQEHAARADSAEAEVAEIMADLRGMCAEFLERFNAGQPTGTCGWCGHPWPTPEAAREHAVGCESNPAVQRAGRAEAQVAQLGEQLVEAMDTVQVFHGRVAWNLYRDNSPEMDRWRTTLRAAGVRVPPHLMPGGVE